MHLDTEAYPDIKPVAKAASTVGAFMRDGYANGFGSRGGRHHGRFERWELSPAGDRGIRLRGHQIGRRET
jgi:hypothetical protein